MAAAAAAYLPWAAMAAPFLYRAVFGGGNSGNTYNKHYKNYKPAYRKFKKVKKVKKKKIKKKKDNYSYTGDSVNWKYKSGNSGTRILL